MKAREFDKKFDDGEDVSKYLDMSGARRPVREQKRVNVDFPLWMINRLDMEASRLGVARQSIIKIWMAERLDTGSNFDSFASQSWALVRRKDIDDSLATDAVGDAVQLHR